MKLIKKLLFHRASNVSDLAAEVNIRCSLHNILMLLVIDLPAVGSVSKLWDAISS